MPNGPPFDPPGPPPENSEIDHCETCSFFVPYEWKRQSVPGTVFGACHRFPPARTDTGHSLHLGLAGLTFPLAVTGQWCGEYKKKTGA